MFLYKLKCIILNIKNIDKIIVEEKQKMLYTIQILYNITKVIKVFL